MLGLRFFFSAAGFGPRTIPNGPQTDPGRSGGYENERYENVSKSRAKEAPTQLKMIFRVATMNHLVWASLVKKVKQALTFKQHGEF